MTKFEACCHEFRKEAKVLEDNARALMGADELKLPDEFPHQRIGMSANLKLAIRSLEDAKNHFDNAIKFSSGSFSDDMPKCIDGKCACGEDHN